MNILTNLLRLILQFHRVQDKKSQRKTRIPPPTIGLTNDLCMTLEDTLVDEVVPSKLKTELANGIFDCVLSFRQQYSAVSTTPPQSAGTALDYQLFRHFESRKILQINR